MLPIGSLLRIFTFSCSFISNCRFCVSCDWLTTNYNVVDLGLLKSPPRKVPPRLPQMQRSANRICAVLDTKDGETSNRNSQVTIHDAMAVFPQPAILLVSGNFKFAKKLIKKKENALEDLLIRTSKPNQFAFLLLVINSHKHKKPKNKSKNWSTLIYNIVRIHISSSNPHH